MWCIIGRNSTVTLENYTLLHNDFSQENYTFSSHSFMFDKASLKPVWRAK